MALVGSGFSGAALGFVVASRSLDCGLTIRFLGWSMAVLGGSALAAAWFAGAGAAASFALAAALAAFLRIEVAARIALRNG